MKPNTSLIDSELRYRRLFETAQDGILILDAETGMVVDVNPFLTNMLGYSHKVFLGKKIWELGFFRDIIGNEANFRELQANKYIRYEDKPLETSDGRRIEVEFISNVYLVNNHEVIQCNIRDISERKRGEAVVRKSEALLKESQRIASLGSYILDFSAGLWSSSEVLDQVFGIGPAYNRSVAGWTELVHPDDCTMMVDYLEKVVLGQRQPFNKEYRIIRQNDQCERWVKGLGKIEFDAQGHPVKLVGTVQDITERKLAEKAMRASESRYRQLLENLRDAFGIVDMDGRLQETNHAFQEMLGYSDTELKQLSYADLTPTKWHALDAQIVRDQILPRGYSEVYEKEYQRKDGSVFPINLRVTLIRNEAGQATGMWAVIRDITEAKLREREVLRLSRLFAALSHVNESVVSTGSQAEMLEKVCRALVKSGGFRMAWIGHPKPETRRLMVDAHWGDTSNYLSQVTITADEQQLGCGPTGTAIREGKDVVCNDFLTDPRTRPWHEAAQRAGFRASFSTPICQFGVILGTLTVYSDEVNFFNDKEIGLLKEAAASISFALDKFAQEEKRQQAEKANAQLAIAIEQAAETIVITDANGTILYANPAFEKSTGYPRAEAIGQNPRLLKSGKQNAEFYRQMWDTLTHGKVWEGHFFNKRRDGTLYEEEATISPIRDAAGKVTSFVAVKRDVTREMQLEAQVRQAQKLEAIGTLAGGVAHDFNNILAVLQLQVGLLKETNRLSSAANGYADEIVSTVKRAADLTRQLLLFSRKEEMQPRDLDLNQSVTDLCKMLRRVLNESIGLELKLAGQPMFVNADPGMIDQVLMNLAANARDAMTEGGQLIIETSGVEFDETSAAQSASARPGAFVCLSVSDSGSGIPPEILPRIFEPFFTTKQVGKGTGLGLATVYGIVQRHKGWINVYSEVGRGTTFKIYLPRLADLTLQKKAAKMLGVAPTGHETILLVEDEPTLLNSIKKTLTNLGYQVLEAPNGVKALEVWQKHRRKIKLLLTDMVMPENLTGKELAERLIQENPKLKVIYMSGYSAEVIKKDFSFKPGVNFLAKPFQTQALAKIIRENLDKPA